MQPSHSLHAAMLATLSLTSLWWSAAVAQGFCTCPINDALPVTPDCDTVIVGGGMAGVYAAFTLSRKGYSNICVFEATRRIGGRNYDVFMSQITNELNTGPGEPVGLGAWRYNEDHVEVAKLVDYLGLETRLWERTVKYFHERGELYDNEEDMLLDAFPKARTGVASGFVNSGDFFDDFLDNPGDLTDPANTDMRFYLSRRYNEEARQFLLATNGGFRADFERSEVRTYFEFLDAEFSDAGSIKRPLLGMEAIVLGLKDEAASNAVRFFTNERVQIVDQDLTGLVVQTTNRLTRPSTVLLAIPPLSIRRLRGSIPEAIVAQPMFNSILPEPVFKSAMVFPNKWWEPELMPLEMVSTGATCLGMVLPYVDDGSAGQGLLHTSYSDGPCASSHWRDKVESLTQAEMQEHILQQLQTIFPGKTIPAPLATVYHYWEAAWHMQRPGFGFPSFVDVQAWARNPLSGAANVAIIGEAVSLRRAWNEGAILSAQEGLNEWFGIADFEL